MADESKSPTAIRKSGRTGGGSSHEKRVCFICGSQTKQIINIHEPRAGPNIVDVISEKFKTRPQNDDKFLCYSCNNWLINWHSLQSKGSTDSGGGSSSMAGSSHRHSSKKHSFFDDGHLVFHDELNDLTITTTSTAANGSGGPKDSNASDNTHNTVISACEEPGVLRKQSCEAYDGDNDDDDDPMLAAAVYAMRSRLQKYFYYPKKTAKKRTRSIASLKSIGGEEEEDEGDDDDMLMHRTPSYHFSSPFRGQKPCDLIYNQTPCVLLLQRRRHQARCKLCSRPLRKIQEKRSQRHIALVTKRKRPLAPSNKASIRLCHRCKISLHARFRASSGGRKHQIKPSRKTIRSSQDESATIAGAQRRLNAIVNANSCIVNKLRMLGTTLSYESDQCRQMETTKISFNDGNGSKSQPIQLYHYDIDEGHTDRMAVDTDDHCTPATTPTHNTGNEIVLTFNTVVTEVFPMELFHMDDHSASTSADAGCSGYSTTVPSMVYAEIDSESDSADEEVAAATAVADARARERKHINEIIKYVPKSLTITLA